MTLIAWTDWKYTDVRQPVWCGPGVKAAASPRGCRVGRAAAGLEDGGCVVQTTFCL